METRFYQSMLKSVEAKKRLFAVLIDPEKFELSETHRFLSNVPEGATHLFVGGSTSDKGEADLVVDALKRSTQLPIFLFPGDHTQISHKADALLFLSLLSGRNAEFLIAQQVKSVPLLKNSPLEIIPTGYILIDGGNHSSVSKVTRTEPLPQTDIQPIVDTALAGQFLGAKLIYLEAGSGARFPVRTDIIAEVRNALQIPLIVGGGIRTEEQKQDAYRAGANMVVMGTVFEYAVSDGHSIAIKNNR